MIQQATSPRYISVAECAKYIRKALKENFPGIKFSVRSSSYSGGASVSVNWTDGPTEKAVEHICHQFEGASFDGMIDLKSYHEGTLNDEPVHYGNDWTSCSRKLSVDFLTAVAQAYCTRYNEQMPLIAVQGDSAYIQDRNYSDPGDYRQRIMWKVNETDASNLDKMFEEEDRQLAEYQARMAAVPSEEVKQEEVSEGQKIINLANDIYGETSESSFWIYASTHRPMSASWARIPGARFVNSTMKGVHTWAVVSAPLDEKTITSYELELRYTVQPPQATIRPVCGHPYTVAADTDVHEIADLKSQMCPECVTEMIAFENACEEEAKIQQQEELQHMEQQEPTSTERVTLKAHGDIIARFVSAHDDEVEVQIHHMACMTISLDRNEALELLAFLKQHEQVLLDSKDPEAL